MNKNTIANKILSCIIFTHEKCLCALKRVKMIVAIQLKTTCVESNSFIKAPSLLELAGFGRNLFCLFIHARGIPITCPFLTEQNSFFRPRHKKTFAVEQRSNLLAAKLVPLPIFFLTGDRAVICQMTSTAVKRLRWKYVAADATPLTIDIIRFYHGVAQCR